ncbi:MAG: TIGR01777 family oxidoreductase, partial [Planctomycetia bacterium]
MPLFVRESRMPASAQAVYDWHARPGAFERLVPPWDDVKVIDRTGPLQDGMKATLQIRAAGVPFRWTAVHHDFEPGRRFTDTQQGGPFARWVHTHRFEPIDDRSSLLIDSIDYAPPLGGIGRLLTGGWIEGMLDRTFAYRHQRTAADLARHAEFADKPRLRVAVAGATGLVGSSLCSFLTTGGHRVDRLVRRPAAPGSTDVVWNPANGVLDPAAIEGCDAVVNLAGANIAEGAWTEKRKKILRDSRVDSTKLLAETIAKMNRPPRVLVNASAIGWYGSRGDDRLDESADPGVGFLPELSRDWEAAAAVAEKAGVRVVQLRIGVVLAAAGGALGKMAPAFGWGVGGRLGSGTQGMSWIALDDLVAVIHHVLMNDAVAGPINATAPNPVS